VEAGTAPRIVRANGTFSPREEVTVAAEVSGQIVEIGPDVGDEVERGTLLFRVDDEAYRLARDQRARVLAESLAKLGLTELPAGEMDLEALPSVERARLEAQNAQNHYVRAQRLRERTPGGVSDQDFADYKLQWDVAESALRGARLLVRTDLAQARTRQAELEVAERLLRETTHRTPEMCDLWLVAERHVAVGDYVVGGAACYRLVNVDPLYLRVRIPESRMEGVEKGRRVDVTTAGDRRPIPATVLRVRPEVDPRTRTYEVDVEVANPDRRLSVGGFATTEISVGEDTGVLFVREGSVVSFAGVTKVFVPDGAKAGERRVVEGRTVDGRVEITSGLKVGDRYLLSPPQNLYSGAPIRVEEPSPPLQGGAEGTHARPPAEDARAGAR
jgi:RND family efflux transporter MFP subunit